MAPAVPRRVLRRTPAASFAGALLVGRLGWADLASRGEAAAGRVVRVRHGLAAAWGRGFAQTTDATRSLGIKIHCNDSCVAAGPWCYRVDCAG